MRSTATTRSPICATPQPATPSTTSRPTKSIAPFRKYADFMERYMKRRTGSPSLCLASSVTEKTLVASPEQRLQTVLATLEQCRTVLIDSGNRESAQLLSVAVLGLRMKINRIRDSDLKALCDEMLAADEPPQSSQEPQSRQGPHRAPLLKLVK